MKLFDKFRPPNSPAPVMGIWEEIGNLEDPIYIDGLVEQKNAGRGCPLTSTPTPKETTMTNNTQAKIAALRDEISELRIKGVKQAAALGAQIHENKRRAEEQEFEKECERMGLRFI